MNASACVEYISATMSSDAHSLAAGRRLRGLLWPRFRSCRDAGHSPQARTHDSQGRSRPSKFLESVGRRAAILGREDGTFEAWIHPIKMVRDFTLSVYFDGGLEPLPLASLAERVEVSPGRVTIVHIRTPHSPCARPGWPPSTSLSPSSCSYIETSRPLRLRASLLPELKPMWPASFGGQSSWYSGEDKALFFSEGLRRFLRLSRLARIHTLQ